MKVSELIAKIQTLPPDSEITEIDIMRLMDDDSAFQAAMKRVKIMKEYLACGNLQGLKDFINAESAKINAFKE